MLDSLLVQLFGREVTDRLAEVGFDSTESIARVDADLLAEEAGIAPTLARRIIAVAVESGHVTPVQEFRSDREEPRPERHIRRPFRRPQSSLAAPPSSPGSPKSDAAIATRSPVKTGEDLSDDTETKTPEPGRDSAGSMAAEANLDEPILRPRDAPYVDDAGLIFTIGNAIRSGRAPAMTIAVAEEILDPPSRRTEASEVLDDSDGKSKEETATTKPTLLQGSYWGFGTWSPQTPASSNTTDTDRSTARKRSGTRKGTPGPPAEPMPRRRSGDEH